MSVKLGEKIRNFKGEEDFPNDIEELNKIRDSLYDRMSLLTGKISRGTDALAEFYKNNIGKNGVSYIREDDDVGKRAKQIDNLVNEFNDTRILIELVEKKIEKHNR